MIPANDRRALARRGAFPALAATLPTPALRDPKRLTCRLRLFIPNNDPLLAKWGPWFKRYDPDLYERVLGDSIYEGASWQRR
jgi:hypothetical protein